MAVLATSAVAIAACTSSDEPDRPQTVIAPIVGTPLPEPLATGSIAPGVMGNVTADGSTPTRPGRRTAGDRAREIAAELAAELASTCPLAQPGDLAAFNVCRKAMHGTSKVRGALAERTLWGRQRGEGTTLAKTPLTSFGRDVLTGMYLPLFMFTGRYAVTYDRDEKLYRVELGARFRNRLPPGQFPYPFWHEDEKWATYEGANAVLLWVDSRMLVIRTALFTTRGTLEPAAEVAAVKPPAFDGKWMWTDASGQTQPKATLFDGLFSPGNPNLKKLDSAYKELALSLRDGQCMACHVPNNPSKMSRLVLMQTPAHAAAEIKRIMSTVRRDTMPVDELSGVETPLGKEIKGELLRRAAAFERVVDAAKSWEADRAAPSAKPDASTVRKRTAEAGKSDRE